MEPASASVAPSLRPGVLVVNLGTPEAPTTRAVRRYLRQFLSDPRVLDIGAVGRFLLLEGVILPLRPRRSAALYRKVWTPEGSPLLVNCRAFTKGLQERLGDVPVELGMRYGAPALGDALAVLARRGAERLIVLPLYPHLASSSTGSTVEEVFRLLALSWDIPPVTVLPAFHHEPGFLRAWHEVAGPVVAEFAPDHVLMSFHGLPERHVRKSAMPACFASSTCCDVLGPGNVRCYRAQCHDTARRLAAALELRDGAWSIAFQSRLGKTPWIKPYTDLRVRELAAAGCRRLAVVCPGFVADCLETLEEIGIRAREDFIAHGGEDLRLVPSLNASPAWLDAAAEIVRRGGDFG